MTGDPGAPLAVPGDGAADPIGLVAGALSFAGAVGLALQALVSFGVDVLKAGVPPAQQPSLTAPHALMLLLGTPAGMVLAGYAAWSVLAPIRNAWRQAMLAIVAGLGSFVFAALLIWPAHSYFGRAGLIGLAAGAGLAAGLIHRRIASRRAPR